MENYTKSMIKLHRTYKKTTSNSIHQVKVKFLITLKNLSLTNPFTFQIRPLIFRSYCFGEFSVSLL